MEKRGIRILGIISLIIGVVFLLNSFSSITGFVIWENLSRNVSSVIGIVFVLVGILLMMAGRGKGKESGLEEKIKRTRIESETGTAPGFYSKHLIRKPYNAQYDISTLNEEQIRELEKNVFIDAVGKGLVKESSPGHGYVEVDLKTFEKGKYKNYRGIINGEIGYKPLKGRRIQKTSLLRIYFQYFHEQNYVSIHGHPR